MGPIELMLVVLVLVLLFGARKLPELGRGVGQGIREFRHSAKDDGMTPRPAQGQGRTTKPEDQA